MYQRMATLIDQNNIPRLTQLVSAALKNRRSISYIVAKIIDAIDGIYLARSSADDKDLAS